MKIVIIDDEPHNIENLARILQRDYPRLDLAGTATTVSAARALIIELEPDLIFLDVQMGGKTGFDLLRELPARDFEVIFITAFDRYGIQAIKFAALDYILKPIDEQELKTAIEKAVHKWERNSKDNQLNFLITHLKKAEPAPSKIALPLFQEIRYVEIASIIRCEAQNTYVYFHLDTGEKILVSRPLKEYDELLSVHTFVRCHQTHLVNPKFIRSYLKEDGAGLLLTNGEKIPVAKAKRDYVKRLLGAYFR